VAPPCRSFKTPPNIEKITCFKSSLPPLFIFQINSCKCIAKDAGSKRQRRGEITSYPVPTGRCCCDVAASSLQASFAIFSCIRDPSFGSVSAPLRRFRSTLFEAYGKSDCGMLQLSIGSLPSLHRSNSLIFVEFGMLETALEICVVEFGSEMDRLWWRFVMVNVRLMMKVTVE
jgi:hypothetical protein